MTTTSLATKIGQMLIIGFPDSVLTEASTIVADIQNAHVGGVILFDFDYQSKNFEHNIISPTQLNLLTQQLQMHAQNNSPAPQPLFIGIDYEGGKVDRLKENRGFRATLSPASIATQTPEVAQHLANEMAIVLNRAGCNVNFAPALDVNVNPDNPVIGRLQRSFSSDPAKVIQYARIFSEAYAAHGIIPVYKHFPGHGSSTTDSHMGFVDVTDTWHADELIPYQTLVKIAPEKIMVMTSHVVNNHLDKNGYPACLSYAMTTGLLRQKLNYTGVVITDDMQMKAITDHYGTREATELAINAGADILIFGNQLTPQPQRAEEVIHWIEESVYAGRIDEHRIHESYERISRLKRYLLLAQQQ